MNRMALSAVLLLLSMILASSVLAQTRFVSDQLVITFRSGPSGQNSILRNLESGDRLELLEELEDEGYSRVRTPDGEEGWVLSQYLQPEPTASIELTGARRDLQAANQRVVALESQLAELESAFAEATGDLSAIRARESDLSTELEDIRSASQGALQMRSENLELRRQVNELNSQNEVAEMEIDGLRRRERQRWFMIGAGVLFGGVLIGLIAPSLRPKRRSSW